MILNYPNFSDIRNVTLKAYNRANIYMNITERHGSEVARKYVKQFNTNDQLSIFTMMKNFNENGFENTRRSFIREGVIA